jgi:hypothetical protein
VSGRGPSLFVLLGVVAAAVLSIGVFAATGARRDPDAERRNARFLMGAGDFLVHWLLWAIRPLDRISAVFGLSADFQNFAGLSFGLASGIASDGPGTEWEAGPSPSAACDMDGRVPGPPAVFPRHVQRQHARPFRRGLRVPRLRRLPARLCLRPLLAAAAITGSLLVSHARAGESVGVLARRDSCNARAPADLPACLLDRLLTPGADGRKDAGPVDDGPDRGPVVHDPATGRSDLAP